VERWATFDCYGTLVDWRTGIGRELARLFGAAREGSLLERYHELEPQVQAGGGRAYREVLAETMRRLADEAGEAVPEGEADALARSLPAWPVFPDVPPALGELRRSGWKIALLSNTDRDLVEASIAAIGVPVDLAVVASEVGTYKPAHGHWHEFARLTGATPERHVHVAQSPFHDLRPAATLGLRTVWINRLGETPTEPSTRELPTLAGLAAVLGELVPA
jgi:2-haloacid dehalogenase